MAARAVATQRPQPLGSAMLGATAQAGHGEGQRRHRWVYGAGPSREGVCEAGASQGRLKTAKELIRCISTTRMRSSLSWTSSTAMSQARSVAGQLRRSTVPTAAFVVPLPVHRKGFVVVLQKHGLWPTKKGRLLRLQGGLSSLEELNPAGIYAARVLLYSPPCTGLPEVPRDVPGSSLARAPKEESGDSFSSTAKQQQLLLPGENSSLLSFFISFPRKQVC